MWNLRTSKLLLFDVAITSMTHRNFITEGEHEVILISFTTEMRTKLQATFKAL